MTSSELAQSVRQARDAYFDAHGFSADAYTERWAAVPIGPVTLRFPNIRARAEALRIHDLHHVATGYDASLRGEAEIGAWEIGGGCGRYWVAWLINLTAVAMGAVIAPRRTWRAWKRGRKCRNLFAREWNPAWLEWSVDRLRREVGTAAERPN